MWLGARVNCKHSKFIFSVFWKVTFMHCCLKNSGSVWPILKVFKFFMKSQSAVFQMDMHNVSHGHEKHFV